MHFSVSHSKSAKGLRISGVMRKSANGLRDFRGLLLIIILSIIYYFLITTTTATTPILL